MLLVLASAALPIYGRDYSNFPPGFVQEKRQGR
jgi:hypothetical protein